ncbi:MAG: nitrate- and nitrite sensing domain-containing protein [Micromonosporaceae bacterium]
MRSKLAVVLTIPAVGFLVVAGVQVASSVAQARALDRFSQQVVFGRQVSALVHELQRERDHTSGVLAALTAPGSDEVGRAVADLAPDRTAVDRATAAFDQAAGRLIGDAALQTSVDTARARLADLGQVRAGVEAGWLRVDAAFDAYTRTIADLLQLLPSGAGDAQLDQAVRAFANLSQAKELIAQIRGRLYAACNAEHVAPGDFETIADVRAQRTAAIDRFRTDAAPSQVARFDEVVSGQAVRNVSRLEQTVVDNTSAAEIGVDPQQWWLASTTELELIRSVEAHLLDETAAVTAARSDRQWRSTLVGSTLTLLLLALATLTSLGIGRSMAESLRTLREQALDVAQRRLPSVIERLRTTARGFPGIEVERLAVRAADEVGEVAEAFTAVHRSAVRLATEQAVMRQNVNAIFVNLARRSQTLVERQLQLLDALESSELDPNQLENLFRLDHLATRMRRNDENLLVLAGADATRRWTDAVPLVAVVQAAIAEIEFFSRVRHDIADELYLAGHVVADLVHLLAELIENATVFSPPHTSVTVLGWAGPDGGAALGIQDEGIGLSIDAVARANLQLRSPMNIDVAAAERMGLVVVGHLASRHGIHVEIRSRGAGATALVGLPAALLAPPPARPLPWSGAPARWLVADAEVLALPAATRRVPTRAEDVLGVGHGPPDASLWWSRRGAAAANRSATATSPAVSLSVAVDPPVNGGLSAVGLPVRVPMAHLPGPGSPPSTSIPAIVEPDPTEVSAVLTSFYGGVHRAVSEDDAEPVSP